MGELKDRERKINKQIQMVPSDFISSTRLLASHWVSKPNQTMNYLPLIFKPLVHQENGRGMHCVQIGLASSHSIKTKERVSQRIPTYPMDSVSPFLLFYHGGYRTDEAQVFWPLVPCSDRPGFQKEIYNLSRKTKENPQHRCTWTSVALI